MVSTWIKRLIQMDWVSLFTVFSSLPHSFLPFLSNRYLIHFFQSMEWYCCCCSSKLCISGVRCYGLEWRHWGKEDKQDWLRCFDLQEDRIIINFMNRTVNMKNNEMKTDRKRLELCLVQWVIHVYGDTEIDVLYKSHYFCSPNLPFTEGCGGTRKKKTFPCLYNLQAQYNRENQKWIEIE